TYRDPDVLASVMQIRKISETLRGEINEEALKVAKIDAFTQLQNQLNLIGSPLEKAASIEKLIMMGVKPEELLTMQKEIIKCNAERLDEKLSILPYLIDNSQVGICTGKSNIGASKAVNIYRLK
ncbi:MAG: hypothetical protein RR582_11675, partial [Niameybacter sp.]